MVLFSTIPVKSAGVYDPWVDVNHDGKINVLDLIKVATGLNTAGDPALNVTVANPFLKVAILNGTNAWVMNWPNSTETNVWYYYILSPSTWLDSPMQTSNGFTYLHILAMANVASGVTVTLNVYGQFGPNLYSMVVYTTSLTYSQGLLSFTIPVPSQNFYFGAYTTASGTNAVSLSYYLTWG